MLAVVSPAGIAVVRVRKDRYALGSGGRDQGEDGALGAASPDIFGSRAAEYFKTQKSKIKIFAFKFS